MDYPNASHITDGQNFFISRQKGLNTSNVHYVQGHFKTNSICVLVCVRTRDFVWVTFLEKKVVMISRSCEEKEDKQFFLHN